ncbi:hypothetical protein J2Z44_001680 [Clostridium punense]|uniref:Gp5/Type VI secretion system Vgr protein OB-fold domain-containing protein n=1 Tax=Clostridium punense TaxID=1054297 RepID=A0ABS4K285_9CLOT|nr:MULTISPECIES: contractile injection system protein, VgrG/Pvc8 family [Clostridium]EQB90140.1 hypothetical protein M918_01270 [Clostridium sp. BL8]MBP2021884.1 hypothetical protein [Clostridium punense]
MSMNVIAYDNLRISTFDLEYLKELKITNEINNHATLELIGILPSDKGEEDLYSTEEETPIDVYYIDNGEKKSIFNGVISKVKVTVTKEVYYLYVKAYSNTYLMDITKRSGSFQNIKMSSHELINKVMSRYSKSDVIINIPNKPIGELVVQYNETDWEFLKRFVSRYNAGILPEIHVPNTKCYIGAEKNSKEEKVDVQSYTVYKQLDVFNLMKKNYLSDAVESDYVIYEIQTPNILKLGSRVNFKNSVFYVGACNEELINGVLCNTYKAQKLNGLRQKQLFNMEIVGASLDGQVIDVKRDKLKIKLDIDENQSKESAYWFPYSTMSASPDGSGWYCMPEINDTVRVYLPTKNEKEAFAISSVSNYDGAGGSDRMEDPSNKYIRTKDDKEMRFTPQGIEINSNSGQAVVKLNEDGSISIIGRNTVNITAQETINIRAEKTLTVTAKESVALSCDKGGSITLAESGDILLKGTEVKNN